MIPFFEYMIDQVKRLLALWADDRVTEAIGANFLYIILSIWLFWMMVNIFLIRPMGGGNLYHIIKDNHARKEAKEARQNRSSVNASSKTDGGSNSE